MKIAGILLAAGQSSRFGSHKLMAQLQGEHVGLLSARLLLAAGVDTLTVVTRAQDTALQQLYTRAGFTCLICDNASAGMSASLQAGLDANRDAPAWLIALADMPFVRADSVRQLLQALRRGEKIVQPTCRGRAGNPVGFHNCYLRELMALSGDRGARQLLQRHRGSICLLEVDDPGVLQDIDRPEDLSRGCSRE